MTNVVAVLVLGLFLGIRHAADPDHIIAVTTLVSRHRTGRAAALVGVAWGVGHTITILAVGGGIILLGWVIPVRLGFRSSTPWGSC
jgi:high-affinity nickel-transport protein